MSDPVPEDDGGHVTNSKDDEEGTMQCHSDSNHHNQANKSALLADAAPSMSMTQAPGRHNVIWQPSTSCSKVEYQYYPPNKFWSTDLAFLYSDIVSKEPVVFLVSKRDDKEKAAVLKSQQSFKHEPSSANSNSSLSPSPYSSGFARSPISTVTSTHQPVPLQSLTALGVPPCLSTPACQTAPRSEFLSRVPSPSSITHYEAYEQAQILAAQCLDLEIEIPQTEELLKHMTKKAGKGRAKEE
ncbi:hypothetical protein BJ165DRAFT_1531801 [Panaeolus papilionaceus]|nr:hypothetical protein BJ165DRAFT_1531801 [Panaeolus papilionaceus]